MRNKIKAILKHPLISGSAIILVGSQIANFLSFLFNLFLSRNLSLSDYGIYASLLSLITMLTLVSGAFIPTVVHFAASYFANNDLGKIRGLFYLIGKITFAIAIAILLFFIIYSTGIGRFLKISDNTLILLAGGSVFFTMIGVINTSLLQAKLEFLFISLLNICLIVFKILFGAIFYYLGFSVVGVMSAIFISTIITYILSFYPLRFLFNIKMQSPRTSISDLLSFGGPAALAVLSLTSFITSDIILVKHFYSYEDAGIYALLSLIARIIFFFSAPISVVMFPLIVQSREKKENYHAIFLLSLLLVFLSSIGITIAYHFFPESVIKIFSKENASLKAAPYLTSFSVFISLYSILTIITNFYLSIKKTIVCIPMAIGALTQIILIWIFHERMEYVINSSLFVTSLLLVILLLYYLKLYKPHSKLIRNEKN